MTRRLLFVSSNEEKFREIRGGLVVPGLTVERVDLDVPEIQALDPAEVAAYKARRAYEQAGGAAVLVEDTGLALRAWNGYPGALVKWLVRAVGEEGLCRQLDAWPDRAARATVALCLNDGRESRCFNGVAEGRITAGPRGTHGFGWDSIFQPDGWDITYGEMRREDKMRISMRARAVEALRTYLLTP